MIDNACHDYHHVALRGNVKFEFIYVDGEYICGIGDDNLPKIKNEVLL